MERNTAADSCGLALEFQSSLVQFVGIRYPNYVTINIVGSTFNTMQNIRTLEGSSLSIEIPIITLAYPSQYLDV